MSIHFSFWIIKYIPLQQGLRRINFTVTLFFLIIKYIPLQQGLRRYFVFVVVTR